MFKEDSPSGKFLIKSYEPGRMLINETWYTQALLLTPDCLIPLEAAKFSDLHPSSLLSAIPLPDVLLIGTGSTLLMPEQAWLHAFLSQGIGVEWMDTRRAAHTFTVLASEARKVAAVLLPH